MKNCLDCGKELDNVKGKKEKKYCDNNCKQKYFRKAKAKEEVVCIPLDEYNRLKALEGNVNTNVNPVLETKIKEEPKQKPVVSEAKSELQAQLQALLKETVPSHVTTPLGKKVWSKENQRKIDEINNKLLNQ